MEILATQATLEILAVLVTLEIEALLVMATQTCQTNYSARSRPASLS